MNTNYASTMESEAILYAKNDSLYANFMTENNREQKFIYSSVNGRNWIKNEKDLYVNSNQNIVGGNLFIDQSHGKRGVYFTYHSIYFSYYLEKTFNKYSIKTLINIDSLNQDSPWNCNKAMNHNSGTFFRFYNAIAFLSKEDKIIELGTVPQKDHCEIVSNNTLYSISPDAIYKF